MDSWFDEHEDLLKEWAEKARFYSWMHHKTSIDYGRLNNILTLPLIIISTINGSANFTLVGNKGDTFFYTTMIPLIIGTMSISTAVLSSLTKFLKTAEMADKHTMFYRQFNVLVRNICLELSLPRNQRKTPSETLNINRHEFDRLVSEAPNIPEHIIVEFNKRFPINKNKPEIANVFNKINIHGRDKDLKRKENMFRYIRNFYKWKSNQTKNIRQSRFSLFQQQHNMEKNASTSSDDESEKLDLGINTNDVIINPIAEENSIPIEQNNENEEKTDVIENV